MQALNEILRRSARLYPNKPYIIDGERVVTYSAFDRQAARLANVLASLGIGKGDPVGLYLPSCPELAIGYYACQKIGAVAAPMSVMYRSSEVESISGRTSMKAMLTDAETFPHAAAARGKIGFSQQILRLGGAVDGGLDADALMREAPDRVAEALSDPDDLAALFFTSGTTGAPKGAMQAQRSIFFTLRDMEVYNRFRFAAEVILDVLPIFNNFGATCLMNGTMYNAGTMVMFQRWDTQAVLAAIARHKVTFMAGTPTMFHYMLNAYDPAKHDIASLRLTVTGGAPVAPHLITQFQQATGVPLTQIYGATESSGYITGEPVVGHRKLGSAGLPFGSAVIEIVDDDGNDVPTGDIGEVRISGDMMGVGYWHDSEASKRIFTPKGWLSGDLGYMDEEGYLVIVDRKKDVIISGGYNIYPLEVEDVLYGHAAVALCALVGVPDETKGEIPVAFIVRKEGCHESEQDFIAYCRERVAAYKAPRRVVFLDELPLGPSGKILKRELRRLVAEKLIAV